MNKLMKKLSLFLICSILVSAFAGCSNKQNKTTAEVTTKPTSEDTAKAKTRTVIGQDGKPIQLPEECKRVAVTAAAFATSTLMLSGSKRIVAIDDSTKSNTWVMKHYPSLASLPVVFAGNEVNMEELLKTQPDLVVYSTRYGEKSLKQLNDFAIPTAVLSSFNNVTILENIRKTQLLYGELIGGTSESKMKEYDTYFKEAFSSIKAKTDTLSDANKPKVLHIRGFSPLVVTNKTGVPYEWITLAGGISVSAEAGGKVGTSGSIETTTEQVLNWNPEKIICDSIDIMKKVYADPTLANITAVKNKDIIVMPMGCMAWGYNGPEEALMMQWAAKWLHPELFADKDMAKISKEFYKKYYELDLNDQDIKDMLSGQ